MGVGSSTGAVLRACSLCPARALAWAPQCPATSMWPSPRRDSAKVCPVNVREPAGVTKGAEAWAALAEDLHGEGARQDLGWGPTPATDGMLPPTRVPGADGPARQAEVPGTGQKPGSTEPRTLCQAAGSRPKTRATRPLPVSRFISLTCFSAHTCVSLAGRGAVCLPGLPAGTFPWFPAPARSLPAAGKCSLAGSAASLKNDFLPSQKRAKYSAGINRETDITPKCPCEKRAGQKVLLKARDEARGPGGTRTSSRVTEPARRRLLRGRPAHRCAA